MGAERVEPRMRGDIQFELVSSIWMNDTDASISKHTGGKEVVESRVALGRRIGRIGAAVSRPGEAVFEGESARSYD